MKNTHQVLWAIIIVVVAITLVVGAFLLSFAEGNATNQGPTSSPTFTPTYQLFTPFFISPVVISPTPSSFPSTSIPTLLLTDTSTTSSAPTPSLSPTETPLFSATVTPGTTLHASATSSMTQTECTPPKNWVVYIVQRSDTLYRLSLAFGVSVADLQKANCMGTSTRLLTGQKLYVPPGPTRTPSPTPLLATDTPTIPVLPTSLP